MVRHQELQPGFVIADRYEVIKCLGNGSMGAVYACKHKELSGHIIAAKVLFPEVANDKVSAQRFRNEIFASYGVSHPNVVRAYEYIKEKGIVAYTMEYVNGGDLADCLRDPAKLLPINRIIEILIQMTAGVQAIHESGIIHRDLKPENILLTKSGDVKIADFGIARTERGPRLTEHGGVVGTIDYVSPEYMLNSQVDYRSDIYAMGVLAFEMITGVTPFREETVYDTMVARLKKDVEPPSNQRNDCPHEFDDIVLNALKRDPKERYQTAKEFHEDLVDLQKMLNGESHRVYQNKVRIQERNATNELKETERIRELIRKVQNVEDNREETHNEMESVLSRATVNANRAISRDIEINEPDVRIKVDRLAANINAKQNKRFLRKILKILTLSVVIFILLVITSIFIDYLYPEYNIIDKIFNLDIEVKKYFTDKIEIIKFLKQFKKFF